jgi:hypothetical protein
MDREEVADDLAETITMKPTKNIFFAVFAVFVVQFLMWLPIRSSQVLFRTYSAEAVLGA